MKKGKVRTFQNRLQEDIKDPEFKAYYREECEALNLATKIVKLREKKGLSQQQLAKLMGTRQRSPYGRLAGLFCYLFLYASINSSIVIPACLIALFRVPIASSL